MSLVQHQQQPLPPRPRPVYHTTRTMSLAVLPSSPATTYNPQHDFPATSPSPSKRPKLSLDTSSIAPTPFGKKTTSLRLETLSATSPTVRNTFSNAHEHKGLRHQLTPIATALSASPESSTPTTFSQFERPAFDDSSRSISSSGSSTSSASSISSTLPDPPYKLPFNHTSILRNSPIDRRCTQTTSFAQSKPMFPLAKKVGFKAPLTEEIRTTRFTMRHSDLESSESTISTLDLNEVKEGEGLKEKVGKDERKEVASPHTGDKRESSDEEDGDEGDDAESYPTTPVAGRRKRHRQWVWTLGPSACDGEAEAISSSINESDRSDEGTKQP